jgi:preprotein translocase subunit SecB
MDANASFSGFQFAGSFIRKFEVENDMLDPARAESPIEIGVGSQTAGIGFDGGRLRGFLALRITANAASREGKFSLRLVIVGYFTAPAAMGHERFEQMLVQNGGAILYGAARSIVAGTTAQIFERGELRLPLPCRFGSDCAKPDGQNAAPRPAGAPENPPPEQL